MSRRRANAHLYELAKRGAALRLRELVKEAKNLIGLFPDLRDSVDRDELPIRFIIAKGSGRLTRTDAERPPRRRRQRKMSAAARKAVSLRMKKYCTKPLRGSYFTHQLPVAA